MAASVPYAARGCTRARCTMLTQAGRLNPTLLAAHARDAGPAHADEAVRWSMAAAAEATARHAPDSALHWWRAAYDADRGAALPDAVRRVTVCSDS